MIHAPRPHDADARKEANAAENTLEARAWSRETHNPLMKPNAQGRALGRRRLSVKNH